LERAGTPLWEGAWWVLAAGWGPRVEGGRSVLWDSFLGGRERVAYGPLYLDCEIHRLEETKIYWLRALLRNFLDVCLDLCCDPYFDR